jgi:hypothetical protein
MAFPTLISNLNTKVMEPGKKNLSDKMDAERDDATKSFENANKESAAEINRGDAKSKTYKGEGRKEPQGPNYNKESKNADGDTTINAGVFK